MAINTYYLVDFPKQQYVFGSKCAFKQHKNTKKNIKKYKTCQFGRGFQQQEAINYFETYTSVVKSVTNKFFLRLIVTNVFNFINVMFSQLFFHFQRWEVYIKQVEFFHNRNSNQILILLKALYNLKKSACLWFNTLVDETKELGFFQSYQGNTFYLNHNSTYVAVYIDDQQIFGPDFDLINT